MNVETLELAYFSKAKMENEPRWQNITSIFQKEVRARDIVRDLEKRGVDVSRQQEDAIDDNTRAIEKILDREFPEQTVPVRASLREAIDIFYKVNASGVALTDAELALAQISGYWPEARDTFKKKLAQLSSKGFVFKLDFIVYVLLGCMYYLGSDMRKLHDIENNQAIRDVWKLLDSQVLDYVASIMRSHAFVDHTDEINSVYALVPIIAFCFQKRGKHLDESEIRKLVKWFYYSQIRTRYVSQLPQKLDRDLRVIRDSENPFDELLSVISEERPLEIKPDEFVGAAVQHPLFGLMRWYFKSQNAICFTTGVAIRQAMGEKYALERDHIFPFSKLKLAGYGRDNRLRYSLAQEITNRAILTQVANRTKGALDAENYLSEVAERFPNALNLQCVPEDEELWNINNYEKFLQSRRTTLATRLNEYLEGITDTEPPQSPITIEEIISKGETADLEFKSTLRWDLRTQAINKKLEDVVIKTVAAFANAQGGTLLIGVADDGEVLGLELDYDALGGASRDKFELHLRNLFNEKFGSSFVATKVQVTFPMVDELHICQVEISPAMEPLFVNVKDKEGRTQEKFYVRSGNSSQEMPLAEFQNYLRERF